MEEIPYDNRQFFTQLKPILLQADQCIPKVVILRDLCSNSKRTTLVSKIALY